MCKTVQQWAHPTRDFEWEHKDVFCFEKLNLGVNQTKTEVALILLVTTVLTIWFHFLYRLGFRILGCCLAFLFSGHPLTARKYLIKTPTWLQYLSSVSKISLRTYPATNFYCEVPYLFCGGEVIEEDINHCSCAWKGHLYDLQLLQCQKIYLDMVLVHSFLGCVCDSPSAKTAGIGKWSGFRVDFSPPVHLPFQRLWYTVAMEQRDSDSHNSYC